MGDGSDSILGTPKGDPDANMGVTAAANKPSQKRRSCSLKGFSQQLTSAYPGQPSFEFTLMVL
jgi:hypothetical protein